MPDQMLTYVLILWTTVITVYCLKLKEVGGIQLEFNHALRDFCCTE